MRSHMEIDSGELGAPKDVVYYALDVHPSDRQRELVELSEPVCYGLRCCYDSRDTNLAS